MWLPVMKMKNIAIAVINVHYFCVLSAHWASNYGSTHNLHIFNVQCGLASENMVTERNRVLIVR